MPKRFRVEVTRSAERDAIGIYKYIERTSPERAKKWLVEVERQMGALSQLPERCPVIPEADDIGIEYRHLIWRNYRTIFRVERDTVFVVRVVHGAQLLETSALQASFLPDSDD